MDSAKKSKSAAIRARLNHPIIDSDGHHMELPTVFQDYLREARLILTFSANPWRFSSAPPGRARAPRVDAL